MTFIENLGEVTRESDQSDTGECERWRPAVRASRCQLQHARAFEVGVSGVMMKQVIALCAMCARKPANAVDEIDGKRVHVCFGCKADEVPEPPKAPSPRERVLRVLARSYGLDIVELAQVLGDDDELGRARLSAVLARAIRDGLVQYSGTRMNRIYSLTTRGQHTFK
jgi:hypothetical protein